MFCRYELRTTAVESAGHFYAQVLETEFDRLAGTLRHASQEIALITELPEPARARGAPAHWLGHMEVENIDLAGDLACSLGGLALGPQRSSPDGMTRAMKDPCGAVFCLSERRAAARPAKVLWHDLHTTDNLRMQSFYLRLGFQLPSARAAIHDTARRPGVHPHWLYYFEVESLERAAERVRKLGGKVLPVAHPDFNSAYCEDAQGAAFGLGGPR